MTATPFIRPWYRIGTDFAINADDDFGCRWGGKDLDIEDSADVKSRIVERPAGPGAYRLRSYPAAKSITLQGWCTAPDKASAIAARDRIRGLFPRGEQLTLTTDDGMDVTTQLVEKVGKVKISPFNGNSFSWQLPLSANDPRKYSVTTQLGNTQPQSTTSDGLDWAVVDTGALVGLDWAVSDGAGSVGLDWGSQQTSGTITMANPGNAETWPLFTLYGPLTAPVRIISSSGSTIAYSLAIASGDYVVIDCSPYSRSVLLNGTADRYSALSSAQWIVIPEGGTETVTLAASGSGYMTAAWRPAKW
jgi:hypothetical protein